MPRLDPAYLARRHAELTKLIEERTRSHQSTEVLRHKLTLVVRDMIRLANREDDAADRQARMKHNERVAA